VERVAEDSVGAGAGAHLGGVLGLFTSNWGLGVFEGALVLRAVLVAGDGYVRAPPDDTPPLLAGDATGLALSLLCIYSICVTIAASVQTSPAMHHYFSGDIGPFLAAVACLPPLSYVLAAAFSPSWASVDSATRTVALACFVGAAGLVASPVLSAREALCGRNIYASNALAAFMRSSFAILLSILVSGCVFVGGFGAKASETSLALLRWSLSLVALRLFSALGQSRFVQRVVVFETTRWLCPSFNRHVAERAERLLDEKVTHKPKHAGEHEEEEEDSGDVLGMPAVQVAEVQLRAHQEALRQVDTEPPAGHDVHARAGRSTAAEDLRNMLEAHAEPFTPRGTPISYDRDVIAEDVDIVPHPVRQLHMARRAALCVCLGSLVVQLCVSSLARAGQELAGSSGAFVEQLHGFATFFVCVVALCFAWATGARATPGMSTITLRTQRALGFAAVLTAAVELVGGGVGPVVALCMPLAAAYALALACVCFMRHAQAAQRCVFGGPLCGDKEKSKRVVVLAMGPGILVFRMLGIVVSAICMRWFGSAPLFIAMFAASAMRELTPEVV
jgi:hypothetical protein